MNIINLLSENIIPFDVAAVDSQLSGIAKLIGWIFDLFSNFYGAVAIGVIVFTIALKTLVLPLDIYSRVKTKKQSLLMERMRPQMEKLQKQYANDKNLYSQKVMELQKANGYNPLGACLPMVVSLVIFMVIFSAFSGYSNYATLQTYNKMVFAYNESVNVYVMENENDGNEKFLTEAQGGYYVDFGKFSEFYKTQNSKFDEDAFMIMSEQDKAEIVQNFVRINARESSAKAYRENKFSTTFGWIGNLWYPDSMLNKEVPTFEKFSSSVARAAGIDATYKESYDEVTYNLGNGIGREMDTYNGYFVLIVLSIGSMFLQQFITMRSQKAANELSSVDGSAAKTNKWMMIMMPVIFGVFSFFYSAAFSIYMIVNTSYSLVSTLIINKIVEVRFAKNGEKVNGGKQTYNRKRLK